MTQSQPLTILFADVSGSTKLFETRGDVEARRIVGAMLGALAEVCARHGGRVIKTIGDEIMCTYPGPMHIGGVQWQEDSANVTMVQRAIRLDGGADKAKLLLRYRGQVLEMDVHSPPFTLGRDATSSLVIDAEWVSRNHAMIEYKRGYF